MFSHERVWAAIDGLAARHKMTASGLARRAGLDPTTFNKSKRTATDGRPRWPSTESIAKIVEATSTSLEEFTDLMRGGAASAGGRPASLATVPLIGFAQAGAGGYFDDGGFPAGQGWDEIALPQATGDEPVYALEVSGDSMLPLYRDGDIVIVAPGASVRRGDRVVVRTKGGEVMAKVLQRQTSKTIELVSINPDFPDRQFPITEIEWIARILWASQ
ncbi:MULTISPECIES: helix-turn-helix transcriptional regulator [unclassified Aureimonas]|uniref:S24 family peptidase n=1 Tax=unclassified Aureimonas TaxID=2615206 RepID=UPI0006F360A3|nr:MULTISPECIES: helix-turn-helix transcriptional regulator [unclassified Aureimonas]KQT55120.1 DNA-binding protein [Aureimonas sp. Leaf427]KQT70910.1 DNA-binding protein [Aureimonas sp. Leaf460]